MSSALTGDDDDEDLRRRDEPDDVDEADEADEVNDGDDGAASADHDVDDEDSGDPPEDDGYGREPLESNGRGVVRRNKKKSPQRTRQPVTTSSSKAERKNTPTLEEIPREEINRAIALHSYVKVGIRRRLPSGKWARIKSGIKIPPLALFEIGEFTRNIAGGGTFVFDVTELNSPELIVPRWEETIEGPLQVTPPDLTIGWDEKAGQLTLVQSAAAMHGVGVSAALAGPPPWAFGGSRGFGAQPAAASQQPAPRAFITQSGQRVQQQFDVQGHLLPPPPAVVPDWARSFTPDVQWSLIANASSPVAPNDPIAKQWVAREIHEGESQKAQIAQLNERIANLTATFTAEKEKAEEKAKAEVERAREDARRAERERDNERSEARYRELEARLLAKDTQKPLLSAELVMAAAPIVTALITSRSETTKLERSSELQMLTALATKKESNLPELLTSMGPLLVPIIVKWLENSGPQAQAEVHQIEHEQRMMQLKMFSDMVASMVPEGEPAWKQIVDAAMAMFGGVMTQRQLQSGQPQRALPGGRPAGAQGQGQGAPSTAQPGILERLAEEDPAVANTVRLIYQNLPPELGFHTHEWITIIFNLHARLDPTEMGDVIVSHLANCERFSLLPAPLTEVFSDPLTALRQTLGPLPITGQDPAYVEAVIEACMAEIAALQEETGGSAGTGSPGGAVIVQD